MGRHLATQNNIMTFVFQKRVPRSVLLVSILAWITSGHSPAYALQVYTATFDDLSEGTSGQSLSDGGLTFSALDTRQNGNNPPGVFTIDQATANLFSPFSPPNAMTFGGYETGPLGSFGRLGSAWIDFSGFGSSASVDVFSLYVPGGDDISQNSLALEAWDGRTLVASSSISFTTQYAVQYRLLGLTGVTFNRLRLVSSGPVDHGVSFIELDNVRVTPVPEPAPALLLSLSLVVGLCFGSCQRLSPTNQMQRTRQ